MIDKSALLHEVSKYFEKGTIYGNILIHRRLISELEREAAEGFVTGELALEELKKLKEVADKVLVNFEFVGSEKEAGNVDEVMRDYCLKEGCTIVTSDEIQKKIAELQGINVIYLQPVIEELELEKFFTDDTMSVHLKEGDKPKAKRGRPGYWQMVEISDEILTSNDIKRIAFEVISSTKLIKDSFIEIERKGSTIVQLGNYRVIITRPPLSDGWEITATRPVTRKKLEDYNLDERLIDRLRERAEGIVIAGAPGMGKTTFAQALAEFYMSMNKIVKTIESPRDMHLPPAITQYSKNYAEIGELHDILLLSRPDYTVYDEMRNDEDFKLYVDLRLAGIGAIGVVHATSPIDAIHRFINRVDIGTIPNILDTVIFLHSGEVKKVYSLDMTVKVPTGLKEADLARPVIEVKDFLNDTVEYEIYVFGEQTMIVPVKGIKKMNPIESKLNRLIEQVIPDAKVKYENGEYLVVLSREDISVFNRKLVNKIKRLEKKHGVKIRIKFEDNSEKDLHE
ncbi:MAG: PINc/VapC family ATPase [Sulfolobaceae archaeon]|nr:PINc/VapC family ATPase [Sulfolobaceae archaeon]